MRFDGRLKSWNAERGFGFIEPTLDRDEIFVHVKGLKSGFGKPAVGQSLSFEVEIGPKGRKRARAVQHLRSARAPRRARTGSGGYSGLAC